MAFSTVKSFIFYLLVAVILLVGCKKDKEPKEKVSINNFSMQLDGQLWTPYQDPKDPCSSTYSGHFATYGETPFYTIHAYRDPNGRGDAYSENNLYMRIMNVTKPGIYSLNGTYKNDFDSYVIFVLQQPTGKHVRRYINDPLRQPFVVTVDELLPIKNSPTKGFKGSFMGTLYNEADPTDSLIIDRGKFIFGIVNYANHCGF